MKNIAKKLLVPILASRPIAAVANRFFGGGVPVFMLHRMDDEKHARAGGTRTAHLRRCLQYLVDQGYRFTSLEQIVTTLREGQPLPAKTVVFTMDDGFVDQATIAAPIFEEFQCPLTFFVITGMLDQSLWPWDTRVAWITETAAAQTLATSVAGKPFTLPLGSVDDRRHAKRVLHDAIREAPSDAIEKIVRLIASDAGVVIPDTPPAAYQPMTWDMARQLERRGIQFAPHSVTHNLLSRLDNDKLQQEITDSWATLDRELLNPLKVFCYPTGRTGDYDARSITMLRDSGYLAAVTTTPDFVMPVRADEDLLYSLPRFSLPDSMEDFIQCCTWIEYAKNNL
jgi:peptidoglycan/xylan/chitin deacetylase (PgdA/CDA1 family)